MLWLARSARCQPRPGRVPLPSRDPETQLISYSQKPKRSDGAIHVLVVDDSAVVRQVMQGILSADPKIKVSVAADPIIALAKIEKETPDVVITDPLIPRTAGLTFLNKTMPENPFPTIA